jgi:beta-xylosidase
VLTVTAAVPALVVAPLACADGDDPAEAPTGRPASTTHVVDGPSTTAASPTSSSPTSSSRSTPDPDEVASTGVPGVPARPAWNGDFPDPSVLWADGWYHAYATQGSYGLIQQLRSRDLVDWQLVRDGALADVPEWGDAFSVWAPAVTTTPAGVAMYYAVTESASGLQCVSVAVADRAAGPFNDRTSAPLVCPHEQGGAIDPSPLVDDTSRRWLLWKNDGVAVGRPSSIWIQELTDDGLALIGEPVELLATDQPWEEPHVEAPSMTPGPDGTWLLLYSASWWNQPTYGVGIAVCETVTGPCTKPGDAPVVAGAGAMVGPGGAEVFTDTTGRRWLAYHAWLGVAGFPSHRALWLDPLDRVLPDLA